MRSNSRRLATRQAHARQAYYCSCGKIVHGNGGRAAHKAMHLRKKDAHGYIIERAYRGVFGGPSANPTRTAKP